jgi:bifunctional non-homologous end joining protein LigD
MPNRLNEYRRKRDFSATPEPGARSGKQAGGARYMIHLHHARSRHFDLRLQVGGTLRSWAVPKGPSLDPAHKRLAVEVEDHPLDYGAFEGTIPEGHYGAGKVWIWDEGQWQPEGDAAKALKAGRMHFELKGKRLRGAWSLVRTRLSGNKAQWLLIKSQDEAVRSGDEADDTPLSEWIDGQSKQAKNPVARPVAKKARAGRKRGAASTLPQSIDLQLARLSDRAPAGEGWLHEVKYDGYRVLLWRNGDTVRITSRGDQDWTRRLKVAGDAVLDLPCDSCILDGELVVLDQQGRSSFGKLQQRFGEESGSDDGLTVMVFDLLHLDGTDLRGLPQLRRKEQLARLLAKAAAPLHLSGHMIGNGPHAAREACAGGLEGIISKDVKAPYAGGRGGAWLKIKCVDSDEFAVVGYTTGKGARAALGSLLLARPGSGRNAAWQYMGRVGTGMDDTMLRDLLRRFTPAAKGNAVALSRTPDRAQLRGGKPVWVKPQLVVEVEYRGLTEDGLLRQAAVKGLRQDRSVASLKPARRDTAHTSAGPARKEAPAVNKRNSSTTGKAKGKPAKAAPSESGGVRLTHPERELFADPPITKQQLAQFYTDIADFILPGLINRPLLLMRCPDGAAGGQCFFQKHLSHGFPDAVHEVLDPEDKQRWIYIDDLRGLLSLVQMNALEYHVWGCTVDDIDHADRLVFDLDPAPEVKWKQVVKAALEVRERMQQLKLRSFVRTTGGKGLHVVVPIQPVPWTTARDFSHALAQTLVQEQPERYVAVANKARRAGKIFIDYLRNGRGATAVTSYSLRNRPGAPIATPLAWEELPRLRTPQQFTYTSIKRRISRLHDDPWAGLAKIKQSLPRI